jgi:hypothetical protein
MICHSREPKALPGCGDELRPGEVLAKQTIQLMPAVA